MRVLIADDDITSRSVLSSVLRKCEHDVLETSNGAEAWEAVQQFDAPPLAIINWTMPEMDGLTLCGRIRLLNPEQRPYIIMLTGLEAQTHLSEGLDAGADEYLSKPFDPAELRARVGAAERIILLQAALARTSQTDALTQLPNRTGILRTLQNELFRAPREGQAIGVAILDVDHFKTFNDTHGHPAGDDLLQMLASRCLEALRPYDILGRYGGEEFMVVAPNCDPDEGPWERLREAVSSRPLHTCAGDLSVTVSVGVAYEDGSLGLDKVIEAAGQALARAKAAGRNRVELDNCSVIALPEPLFTLATPMISRPDSAPTVASTPLVQDRRVLIADDSFVSRTVLAAHLAKQGCEVIETADGSEAWEIMQQPGAPGMAILDWMMPGINGLEICCRAREMQTNQPPYIILLTALAGKKHLCRGLEAGANDYLGKPYDPEELRARVHVGFQMLDLQAQLAGNVRDLRVALEQVKTLKGIVPICSKCKRIRDDKGYWEQLEVFVRNHSEAEFTHGICPECVQVLYPKFGKENR